MLSFLPKLSAGHFRRHRLEAVLCLIGIALGVAVAVAVDAAVLACVRSFQGAVQSLAGRATHSVFADAGALPDQTYLDLLRKKLPFPLAPVVERGVLARGPASPPITGASPTRLEQGGDVVARLIGVDVFAEKALRSFTQVNSSLDADAFHAFLTRPNTVVLVDALAARLGAKAGSTVTLTVGPRRFDVTVVAVVSPEGTARAQLADVIVADIATAQELAGSIGKIDHIDTKLDDDAQVAAFAAALPPHTVLRSTGDQSSRLAQLVQSYKLNLNALSLMASFVAVFLVYNSMLISVQQRATSLGILRCLGASRAQLAAITLGEAVAFGLVGGVLGVLGGWALSAGLVGLVATTINDLYGAVRPGRVTLGGAEVAKGMALSMASALVGAAVPLVVASRTPPVGAFRGTARAASSNRAAVWLGAAGAGMLALAWAAYRAPGDSPVAGFAMALLIALGFALACPAVTRLGCAAVVRLARPLQLLPAQMAAAGVGRSLAITGVAGGAMMLALSMNVGVRTMVAGFRDALSAWMDQRFAADVFVSAELLVDHKIDATLDPAVVRWVEARPEVKGVVEYRGRDWPVAGKPITLIGTDVAALLGNGSFPTKRIQTGRAYDPARDAIVSEPLAGRAKVDVGSRLTLDAPTGQKSFDVYAVYYDFGNERGSLMLDRKTYAAAWDDDAVNSLHVRVRPGVDPARTAADWALALRRDYPVVVNSYGNIKAEVMQIFDRTFAVTGVLGWLAGGVAFCGLSGALLSLALGRRREYSILAAIGMSGRQTAAWVLGQGLIIAWVASAVAVVAGTALAYVLAYVIQYRSFGWSIPTGPRPRIWVEVFALSTVAAIVSSVYPVLRLRSDAPARNLRE